jgi:hypothetical protein
MLNSPPPHLLPFYWFTKIREAGAQRPRPALLQLRPCRGTVSTYLSWSSGPKSLASSALAPRQVSCGVPCQGCPFPWVHLEASASLATLYPPLLREALLLPQGGPRWPGPGRAKLSLGVSGRVPHSPVWGLLGQRGNWMFWTGAIPMGDCVVG